jgi:RNase P subunit RPR2
MSAQAGALPPPPDEKDTPAKDAAEIERTRVMLADNIEKMIRQWQMNAAKAGLCQHCGQPLDAGQHCPQLSLDDLA